MSNTYVEYRGVTKTYRSERASLYALEPVQLDIAEEEFISIVGPSGCGKSTLLSITAGLLPASGGEVRIQGRHGQFRDSDTVDRKP